MESILSRAWNALTRKLGTLAGFILPIGRELEVAIADRDTARAQAAADAWKARAHELREALDAGDAVFAEVETALEDGRLDALEASRVALKLERFVDEAEDVLTGTDEDDNPPAGS